MFVGFWVSPALVIAAGYAAKIPKFRVKRPKIEPPIFRDRSLLCRLDAGGVFQDGPKTPNRPKWPSRLDGAHTFKHMCFSVFCSFRLYVVIGALPAPSLHQNELNASTACTFSKHLIFMVFVKTQPSVVIGAPLPISWKVSDLMRVTLARQSGFRKLLFSRPRRTTQRTVVIGGRPAPLLPQNGLFTSTACTFSTTCVFACFCSFPRAVVIRIRPAPSFDQYGLLASTACTFLRRLMLIVFG